MRQADHQSGFGILVVIIAFALVIVVAVSGFVVYQHNHKSSEPVSSSHTTGSTTKQTQHQSTTTTPAPNQNASPSANTFAIPEIHAKITLPSGLSPTDLKYSIDTSTGVPVADFTTASLEQADGTGSCSASQAPIGVIWRTTQNPASGSVTTKQIGQYFYAFEKPQGSCTGNVNAGKLEQSQTSLLEQAFETIE